MSGKYELILKDFLMSLKLRLNVPKILLTKIEISLKTPKVPLKVPEVQWRAVNFTLG